MNDLDKALALSCREYRRQGLEALYAQPFETALLPCLETAAAVCTGDAPQWTGDARADLLGAFLCCGSLLERYEGLGIPRETFESTVEDIGRWAGVHRGCTGQIGLSECAWLSNHLRMRLFQLGRVQFCMDTAAFSAPALGIEPGEDVLYLHICRSGPLTAAACDDALRRADEFFPRFFPERSFRHRLCCSWLLDEGLLSMVAPDSNIAGFQRRFQIVSKAPSDAILRFVFRWDARRETLGDFTPENRFQAAVKAAAEAGAVFYEATGRLMH